MKKTYIKPSVEVTSFVAEDILTASGYGNEVSIIDNTVSFKSSGNVQIVDGVSN